MMKFIKYLLPISLFILFIAGCKKDIYDDTSFVDNGASPAALSVLFEITQDNSGLVTITPNGENSAVYTVSFGDAGNGTATVQAGGNVKHTYKEGVYNVKISARSITGKVTEITKQLTVSFRQPENLDFTITKDANNNYKVTVNATALYETNFRVFWGDNPSDPGFVFLEGVDVPHTYAAVGTYSIKVIAYSGGAATRELIKTVSIVDPVLLPITFESPTVDYTFSGFGGGAVTRIANPQSTGINTSGFVGRMVKNAGEVYGGALITLGGPINFATDRIFRMKVYSPRIGAKVLLKVENLTNGGINFEKEVTTTKANEWEDMYFDFRAINVNQSYHKVVLIFDLGTMGNGTANFTWLFDDIRLSNTLPTSLLTLPVTFDDPAVNYNTTDFGGALTLEATDPTMASNKIKRTIKTAGAATWAGTTIGSGFTTKVPFTAAEKRMTLRVYSPAAGIPVRLKVEDRTDNTKSVETDAVTTVANAWETLVFNFGIPATGTANINLAFNYDKASVFFNFGTGGTGSEFLWDDLKFGGPAGPGVNFPLTFENAPASYNWGDFAGGVVTVIANDRSGGINTSAQVAKMVKNAGQVYGGSTLTLDNPMDFSTMKTMRMKVYSPRVGAKVLLKVETLTIPSVGFEIEKLTTVANAWEDMTFDYSAINTGNTWQKLVLIFDNGIMGDGTANFTWRFDDIRQTN